MSGFQDMVLGGVGPSAFYDVGNELCTNPGFEENTTGWAGSSGAGMISRVQHAGTFFGDYVLKIVDDESAFEFAYYDKAMGESLQGKLIWIKLWLLGDSRLSGKVVVGTNSGDEEETFNYTYVDKQFPLTIFKQFGVTSHQTLRISIYPNQSAGLTGIIYADHVRIREINTTYQLPNQGQQNIRQDWVPVGRGGYNLGGLPGSLKDFTDGYRYVWDENYMQLNAAQEAARRHIINIRNGMVFRPHDDADYSVLAVHGGLPGGYRNNRYYGHTGPIHIEAVDVEPFIPVESVIGEDELIILPEAVVIP